MSELATMIAAKTREIEAVFHGWTYRKPCRWCSDGYVPIPSSVSDAAVHPDTPIGRVVCPNPLIEDDYSGWCSSCDKMFDGTVTVPAERRVCPQCGDWLITTEDDEQTD